MLNTLNLVIVGHSNVGKTSFLRTLTRNANFGYVSDKPGTTRHVEGIQFNLSHQQTITFFDTPGLEDSIALYDYINDLIDPKEKLDGIDKLERFLVSTEAAHRFEQEAKVIRQLLKGDVGLYVVDVREPILAKYHDELTILTESNKPLLAILNFTADQESKEKEWKELLARVGIHAVIRFDAVAPPLDGEERLYQSLALLIEPAKQLIETILHDLAEKRRDRHNTAKQIIAEALIDVAASQLLVKNKDASEIEQLQKAIREREYQAINALLKLYQFSEYDQSKLTTPLIDGRFEHDLFNPEALQQMGIKLTKGIISGAIAGASIDLAVGGATLGTATAIGAAVGGLSQTISHYGEKMKSVFSGYYRLTVDDDILCFLSLRLQKLVESLNYRGHANLQPITLPHLNGRYWQKGQLPKILNKARAHVEWSSLNKKQFKRHNESRKDAIEQLAKELP